MWDRLARAVHLTLAAVFALYLAGCAGHAELHGPVDSHLRAKPPTNSVTLWGHSTCYIDIDGTGFMTDPVLAASYSPWHRRQVPAPPESVYAGVDYILISHAHRDHLNKKTLARMPGTATVLCPEPCAEIVRKLGLTVVVMHPGDSCAFSEGWIIAAPAYHPGRRNSLHATANGGAIGFVIRTAERTLYYSGDTEYFEGLTSIGEQYHPDLALLNVNGHLPPLDAVRAFIVLGSPTVIPIHSIGYSGPTAVQNIERREEFSDILGTLALPIAIGESYQLDNESVSD